MAYATVEDMIARFGEREMIQLTSPGATEVDLVVMDQAINDAGSLIDTYLTSRYQLPLSSVPTVLRRTCCSVARYYLYNDKTTEAVEVAHKDAIKYLSEVAKGTVQLGVSSSGELPSESSSVSQMTSNKTVWGRDRSKSFI